MMKIIEIDFVQLHECRQHLERALRYVELTDFERNIEQLYKAIQYLDLIIDCVNNAKDNILLPKKKRIDDLRRNKNTVKSYGINIELNKRLSIFLDYFYTSHTRKYGIQFLCSRFKIIICCLSYKYSGKIKWLF